MSLNIDEIVNDFKLKMNQMIQEIQTEKILKESTLQENESLKQQYLQLENQYMHVQQQNDDLRKLIEELIMLNQDYEKELQMEKDKLQKNIQKNTYDSDQYQIQIDFLTQNYQKQHREEETLIQQQLKEINNLKQQNQNLLTTIDDIKESIYLNHEINEKKIRQIKSQQEEEYQIVYQQMRDYQKKVSNQKEELLYLENKLKNKNEECLKNQETLLQKENDLQQIIKNLQQQNSLLEQDNKKTLLKLNNKKKQYKEKIQQKIQNLNSKTENILDEYITQIQQLQQQKEELQIQNMDLQKQIQNQEQQNLKHQKQIKRITEQYQNQNHNLNQSLKQVVDQQSEEIQLIKVKNEVLLNDMDKLNKNLIKTQQQNLELKKENEQLINKLLNIQQFPQLQDNQSIKQNKKIDHNQNHDINNFFDNPQENQDKSMLFSISKNFHSQNNQINQNELVNLQQQLQQAIQNNIQDKEIIQNLQIQINNKENQFQDYQVQINQLKQQIEELKQTNQKITNQYQNQNQQEIQILTSQIQEQENLINNLQQGLLKQQQDYFQEREELISQLSKQSGIIKNLQYQNIYENQDTKLISVLKEKDDLEQKVFQLEQNLTHLQQKNFKLQEFYQKTNSKTLTQTSQQQKTIPIQSQQQNIQSKTNPKWAPNFLQLKQASKIINQFKIFIMLYSKIQQIKNSLLNMCSANNDLRMQALQHLTEIQQDESLVNDLFQIISDSQWTYNIVLSACIMLAKKLKSLQNNKAMAVQQLNSTYIQNAIIASLLQYKNEKAISKQLEISFWIMVKTLIEEHWPKLPQTIVGFLKQSNKQELIVYIKMIQIIFECYPTDNCFESPQYTGLQHQLLPFIELIISKYSNEDVLNDLPIKIQILKIFLKFDKYQIKSYFKEQQLTIWLIFCKKILDYNMDSLNMRISDYKSLVECCKQDLNKCFKYALKCVIDFSLIVFMFSNKPDLEYFSDLYIKVIPSFLEIALMILLYNQSHQYTALSYEIVSYLFQLIQKAILINCDFAEFLTKEFIQKVVQDIAIPYCQIQQLEYNFLQETPIDYLYVENNIAQEILLQMKYQASSMLQSVYVWDSDALMAFLEHCAQQFQQNQPNYQYQEGLLFIINQCISTIIQDLKSQVDTFCQQILIPALKSQDQLVQARACEIIYHLEEVNFENMNQLYEIMGLLIEKMQSQNIILKFKSIKGFCLLVTIEETHQCVWQYIPDVLEIIFKTIDIVQLKELNDALQIIVENFNSEVQPFAMKITNTLLQNFYECLQKMDNQDQDDLVENSDGLDTLESTLIALNELLQSGLQEEFLINSATWFIDLMSTILTNQNLYQLCENLFLILNTLVFNIKSLNDQYFFIYSIICQFVRGRQNLKIQMQQKQYEESQLKLINNKLIKIDDIYGFFNKILAIWGNYIQKAPQVIILQKDDFGIMYIEYLFDIIDRLSYQAQEDCVDINFIYCNKIFQILIENGFNVMMTKQKLVLEAICKYCDEFLKLQRSQVTKISTLQTMSYMFYQNPIEVIKTWNSLKIVDNIIYSLFSVVESFLQEGEIDILIYFAIGLLQLYPYQFPKSCSIEILMKQIVKSIYKYYQEVLRQNNFEEEECSEEKDMAQQDDLQSWNEYDQVEDEEEEVLYNSFFEQQNTIALFSDFFNKFQMQKPQEFQQIISLLSQQEQITLQNSIEQLQILTSQ